MIQNFGLQVAVFGFALVIYICFFCSFFVAIFFYRFLTAIYFLFVSMLYCIDILEFSLVLNRFYFSKLLRIQQEYLTFSEVRLRILPLLRRDISPLEIKLVTGLPRKTVKVTRQNERCNLLGCGGRDSISSG